MADKYAGQAANAQEERSRLNKRWAKRAAEQAQNHQGRQLLNDALNNTDGRNARKKDPGENRPSQVSDERPVMFLPTEADLRSKQFDYEFNGFPRHKHGPFAHELGLT